MLRALPPSTQQIPTRQLPQQLLQSLLQSSRIRLSLQGLDRPLAQWLLSPLERRTKVAGSTSAMKNRGFRRRDCSIRSGILTHRSSRTLQDSLRSEVTVSIKMGLNNVGGSVAHNLLTRIFTPALVAQTLARLERVQTTIVSSMGRHIYLLLARSSAGTLLFL